MATRSTRGARDLVRVATARARAQAVAVSRRKIAFIDYAPGRVLERADRADEYTADDIGRQ